MIWCDECVTYFSFPFSAEFLWLLLFSCHFLPIFPSTWAAVWCERKGKRPRVSNKQKRKAKWKRRCMAWKVKRAEKEHVHITLFFSWILKKYLHIKSFLKSTTCHQGSQKLGETIGESLLLVFFSVSCPTLHLHFVYFFYSVRESNEQQQKQTTVKQEWSKHRWAECMFMKKIAVLFLFSFNIFPPHRPLKKIMTV